MSVEELATEMRQGPYLVAFLEAVSGTRIHQVLTPQQKAGVTLEGTAVSGDVYDNLLLAFQMLDGLRVDKSGYTARAVFAGEPTTIDLLMRSIRQRFPNSIGPPWGQDSGR